MRLIVLDYSPCIRIYFHTLIESTSVQTENQLRHFCNRQSLSPQFQRFLLQIAGDQSHHCRCIAILSGLAVQLSSFRSTDHGPLRQI